MKKTVITIIGVVLVIALVLVCILFFRNGSGMSGMSEQQAAEQAAADRKEAKNEAAQPAQEGEPDEAAKAMAKRISAEAKNIVSTGQTCLCKGFLYTVKSWEITKSYPGYAPPEGLDLEQRTEAQLDASGNITNDFSYVIVDISAQNPTEESITDYLKARPWDNIYLKFVSPTGGGSYSGEMIYLGEETPREYGQGYGVDKFEGNETKEIVLIYVVNDGLLDNQGMYLELNQGAVVTDTELDTTRYIILN